MYSNEAHVRTRTDMRVHLPDNFPRQSEVEEGDALTSLLLTMLYNIPLETSKKSMQGRNEMRHIRFWLMLMI
jgi:hypothetical protein